MALVSREYPARASQNKHIVNCMPLRGKKKDIYIDTKLKGAQTRHVVKSRAHSGDPIGKMCFPSLFCLKEKLLVALPHPHLHPQGRFLKSVSQRILWAARGPREGSLRIFPAEPSACPSGVPSRVEDNPFSQPEWWGIDHSPCRSGGG